MDNPAICSFPECGRSIKAAELCSTHYNQRRRGEELRPILKMGSWVKRTRPETCTFPGCGRAHASLGLCDAHYWQHRHGNELRPVNTLGDPLRWLEDAVTNRNRSKCWLDWPYAFSLSGRRIIDTGEGDFRRPHLAYKGKLVGAARLAFFLDHGHWPKLALHRCDRPACLNPDHLYDGTVADNMRDMHERGRDRHHARPAP